MVSYTYWAYFDSTWSILYLIRVSWTTSRNFSNKIFWVKFRWNAASCNITYITYDVIFGTRYFKFFVINNLNLNVSDELDYTYSKHLWGEMATFSLFYLNNKNHKLFKFVWTIYHTIKYTNKQSYLKSFDKLYSKNKRKPSKITRIFTIHCFSIKVALTF